MDDLRDLLLPWVGSGYQHVALTGGMVNDVGRVSAHDGTGSVVVKRLRARSRCAGVGLDGGRIRIEAAALQALAAGGDAEHIADDDCRPPRLLAMEERRGALLLEDLGTLLPLDVALIESPDKAEELGQRLGQFIGSLHACRLPGAGERFDNAAIQRVRHDVQYKQVGGWLRAIHAPQAAVLGRAACRLGEGWQRTGCVWIMGDLWPASILTDVSGRLRLIDWEFSHFGFPGQDVGHLSAHLRLLALAHPASAAAVVLFGQAFEAAYAGALGACVGEVWHAEARRDASLHAGCEMLMRVLGPFRQAGLESVKSEVVTHAVTLMCALAPAVMPTDPSCFDMFKAHDAVAAQHHAHPLSFGA